MPKIEENFNPETISALKTSLMGPLSGIGDSFFQGTIRVLAFGFGINLAQQGSILGPYLGHYHLLHSVLFRYILWRKNWL